MFDSVENAGTRRGPPPPLISNGIGSTSTSPTASPLSDNLGEGVKVEERAGQSDVVADRTGKVRSDFIYSQ